MKDREEARVVAMALCDEAYAAQREGDFDRALQLYTRSLEHHPTPEAYTYRGWARSFLGQYEEAIEDCRQAIELDPGYGNPYNDIGAYLIELGRLNEAVEWLHKAIDAPRYEARCYPFMNLGRIHLAKGELVRALSYFQKSCEIDQEYGLARQAMEKLRLKLN